MNEKVPDKIDKTVPHSARIWNYWLGGKDNALALMVGTREGATDYIECDARDPQEILRRAARTLDFTRPVAIMMLGILPFIGDDDEVRSVVKQLLAAVPAGSYLTVTHSTSEATGDRVIEAVRQWNQVPGTVPYHLRSPGQIAGFFDGLELIEPGVVSCPRWRPEPWEFAVKWDMDEFCAVGRKN